MQLKGYTDVDWGRDLDERKSTFGFTFLLNNGSCIALSTMETEFVV